VFTFGTLAVGNAGTGVLTLSGGALAGGPAGGTSAVVVQIGVAAHSSGSVTVTDSGTKLTASTIDIGSAAGGTGVLDILAGAVVKAADVTIAATGTLALNGGTLTTDPLTLDAGAMITASGEIDGDISGSGSITISPGGALSLTGGVGSGISVDFAAGASELLSLGEPGDFAGTIDGYVNGDSIGLGAFASASSSFAGDELIVTSGGQQIAALRFAGDNPDGSVFASVIGGEVVVSCYAQGTRIATASGDVAVEALREGDLVRTASGTIRPITWIGHRRVDCSRHAKPETVRPVRVRADAFGPGLPCRDLVLSPEHAVAQAGVLIPIHCLINRISIVREEHRREIVYWHVELASHDLLLAENLPAESYLGGDEHADFDGAAVLSLHPRFARNMAATPCAPIRTQGAAVEAVRAGLMQRARMFETGMTLRA
jgi:T5SS/PEP-CTERM-associated repeat protein